jgi:hypothetical protein
MQREAFDDNAAETIQVNQVGEFDAVAKGAAGSEDRIREAQRADVHAQVNCTRLGHFV